MFAIRSDLAMENSSRVGFLTVNVLDSDSLPLYSHTRRRRTSLIIQWSPQRVTVTIGQCPRVVRRDSVQDPLYFRIPILQEHATQH